MPALAQRLHLLASAMRPRTLSAWPLLLKLWQVLPKGPEDQREAAPLSLQLSSAASTQVISSHSKSGRRRRCKNDGSSCTAFSKPASEAAVVPTTPSGSRSRCCNWSKSGPKTSKTFENDDLKVGTVTCRLEMTLKEALVCGRASPGMPGSAKDQRSSRRCCFTCSLAARRAALSVKSSKYSDTPAF